MAWLALVVYLGVGGVTINECGDFFYFQKTRYSNHVKAIDSDGAAMRDN